MEFKIPDIGPDAEKDPNGEFWIAKFFALVIFIGLSFAWVDGCQRGECREDTELLYRLEYAGFVKRTFRQGAPWAVELMNGTICYGFAYEEWSFLKPGDKIIKHKNELNYIVVRDGDTTHFNRTVKDCEQFRE